MLPLDGQARFEEIKNLSSCFQRGCRNCLVRNTKRGKRKCTFPLQGVAVRETSYISLDDCFAAMQIDLSVRGWIGAFATLAAYTIPISSRTMSFPADLLGGNLRQPPLLKTRQIIALPPPKSNRKAKLPPTARLSQM